MSQLRRRSSCRRLRCQWPGCPPFRSSWHSASHMWRVMERWLSPSKQVHLSLLPWSWVQRCPCPPSPLPACSTSSEGTIYPMLLVPRCRLPSKKVLRLCLDCHRSCSLRPLHGGASSPASPSWHFGVLGGFLQSAWGTVVEVGRDRCHEFAFLELLSICVVHGSPHQDALSSCRSPRKPKWCHPQLPRQHAHHTSLHLGLLSLSVGHSKCRE
jgi:hypothetical protein